MRGVHHGHLASPCFLLRASRVNDALDCRRDRGDGDDVPGRAVRRLVRGGGQVPLPKGCFGYRCFVGPLAGAVGDLGRDSVFVRKDLRAEVSRLVQSGGEGLPSARDRHHRYER